MKQLEVKNELAGSVSELGFVSGATVEKNQLLVQFDVRQERASLAAAEAEARRVEEQRRAEEQQKAASQEPAAEAPEAPRIKVGQLVEPGPGVVAPSLVSYNKPEYPPQARRLRVEGIVEVAVLVDENGAVSQARVTKPISQNVGLNEAALAAAKTARFRPATKDGVRVKVWTAIRFPFKL